MTGASLGAGYFFFFCFGFFSSSSSSDTSTVDGALLLPRTGLGNNSAAASFKAFLYETTESFGFPLARSATRVFALAIIFSI